MWIAEKIRSVESKKISTLCCVLNFRHTAKNYCTRQSFWFAVCQARYTAKSLFAVCFYFCRVFRGRHMAKKTFAVCPILCTRQTLAHTVNYHFPVVFIKYFDPGFTCRAKWDQIQSKWYKNFLTVILNCFFYSSYN